MEKLIMKVITIKQPWASLIAKKLKEYEFRTWKTNYRGEILIHAGKGIDKTAMKRFEYLNLEYPRGCIIAKATITDCLFVDDKMRKNLLEKDSKVYHNLHTKDDIYGFKIDDVQEIEPIYVKGQLGLWNYDLDTSLTKK